MIVGADIGGTFTDVVAVVGDAITVRKVPTSAEPADAMAGVLEELAPDGGAEALVHGTTVATNALLERAGARTVLITDPGFEDIIEIARQDRPSLYDPYDDRPEPLVARSDRIGVAGDETPDVDGAEAVAIALVRGHTDPEREAAIAATVAARHPDLPVSASSVVAPEFREYERTSTTVLNAYLTPITARYLRRLGDMVVDGRLADGVSVMRSSGGLMSLTEAADLPAAILLSGPAGGVIAARAAAADAGIDSVVSFDMGGTSTDVCLIVDGRIDVSYERSIAGFACRMPAVGVHTVGAGGGSIAWIDPGGALRVGPRSAGSHPGPACYGRGGTEATVTDANVVLHRIDPEGRLGGTLSIEAGRAQGAVQELASRLGMGREEAALGILAIAEETMAGAVRTVSVARGHDPTRSYLVAFGGAGGLHASAVARRLDMAGVLVPPAAGVLSALGLVMSPPRSDAVRAVLVRDGDLAPVEVLAGELATLTRRSVAASGSDPTETQFLVDVRYVGQAHEITVPWVRGTAFGAVVDAFELAHRERYGFDRTGDPVEITAVRASTLAAPSLVAVPGGGTRSDPIRSDRDVVGRDGTVRSTAIVDRVTLGELGGIDGPAIIQERDTTTFVDADERVRVLDSGALEVTW